jgi:hypothetical protein
MTSTTDTKPQCGNCVFYGDQPIEERTEGACRFRAPLVLQRARTSGEAYPVTRWPTVFAREWCGDWKPKTEAAETGTGR